MNNAFIYFLVMFLAASLLAGSAPEPEQVFAGDFAMKNEIPLSVSADTALSPLPGSPFVREVKTGAIIYLGMTKDEAEAIAGAPAEEGKFGKNMFIYEGVALAFRDGSVVYIAIDYEEERWAANGAVMSGMTIESAFEALGISFEENTSPYDIGYFTDGSRRQVLRGDYPADKNDLQWMISFLGHDAVGKIVMGDMQYLTRFN